MAAAVEKTIGTDTLIIDKSGDKVDLKSTFTGKIVGFYFSGEWCPPCKSFTPLLIKFYTKYAAEKNFEIIFISSDRDEQEWTKYFEKMPWLSLNYADREKKR